MQRSVRAKREAARGDHISFAGAIHNRNCEMRGEGADCGSFEETQQSAYITALSRAIHEHEAAKLRNANECSAA